MFRAAFFVGIIFATLFLCGCASVQGSSGGGGGETTATTAASGMQEPPPAPVQGGSAVLHLPETSQFHQPTASPQPDLQSPQRTPANQERPFRLCSPLADISLTALPEIISDPYHPPPPGREERHHGVDFAFYHRGGQASIEGAGIQSALSGVAAASVADRFPYGNVVIIETPAESLPPELAAQLEIGPDRSLYTLYAHMQSAPLVALGEAVDACQALGAVGRSGNAGGPHLHVETRIGPAGQRFDSLSYYKADSTPQERENYLRWRTGGEFQHFDPMRLFTGWK